MNYFMKNGNLRWSINLRNRIKTYSNKVTIDKGNGKVRYIYPPTFRFKTKTLLPITQELSDFYEEFLKFHNLNDVDKAVIGFRPGKNIVIGAKQHVGFKYTISMDLENFFDNVEYATFKEYFPIENKVWERRYRKPLLRTNEVNVTQGSEEFEQSVIPRQFIYKHLMVGKNGNKGLPQGFNTSPTLSNFSFLKTDKEIIRRLKELEDETVYTRYADDITISCNSKESINKILDLVKDCLSYKYKTPWNQTEILYGGNFILNNKKTKVYSAKRGNRNILGISVGDTVIYPSRKIKRKLRAAQHQNNEHSMNGLKEYMLLKEAKQKNI